MAPRGVANHWSSPTGRSVKQRHRPLAPLHVRVQQIEGQGPPLDDRIAGKFEQLLRRVTQSTLPETKLTRRYIEVSRQPSGTGEIRVAGPLLAGPTVQFLHHANRGQRRRRG